MSASLEQIEDQARALSPEERAKLAQSMLDEAIRNGFRISDKLYKQVSSAYKNE